MRVLGGECEVQRPPLPVDARGERHLVGPIDHLLGEARRDRRLRRDRPRDRLRLAEPVLGDARDKSRRQRFVRAQEPAREDDVHGDRFPDRARQALRAAGAGDDADAGLRLAELRGRRCDDQVARHRQLVPAAEAVAGDRRDDRRPGRADPVPALDAARVVHVDRRSRGHLADVGPRRERLLAAGEDDAANPVLAVKLLERLDDAVHQLVGERVQPLGAVHGHDGDLLVALDRHEAHRSRNLRIASCASSFSIESASQSRAWPIVSCQETSRHQLSCCFA